MPDSIPVNNNSSQTVISDLPEYVKPYWKMLLNASSAQVFTPGYVASQVGSQAQVPTQNTYQPPYGAGGQQPPYPGANPAPQPQQPPGPQSLPYQPTTGVNPYPGAAQNGQGPFRSPGSIAPPVATSPRYGGDGGAGRGDDAMNRILGDPIFGARRGMARGGQVDPMLQAAAVAAQQQQQPSVLGGDVYTTGIGGIVSPSNPVDQRITGGNGSGVTMIGPSGPAVPGSPGSTPGTGPVIPGGFYSGNTNANGTVIGGPGAPGFTPGVAVHDPNAHLTGQTAGYGYTVPATGQDWAHSGVGVAPTAAEQSDIEKAKALFKKIGVDASGMVVPGSYPGGSTRNASLTAPGYSDLYDAKLTAMMSPEQLKAAMNPRQPGMAGGGIIGLAVGGPPYNTYFGGAGTTPNASGFGTTQTTPNPAVPPATSGGGVFQPYQAYQGQRLLDPNQGAGNVGISNATRSAETGLSSMPTNMFTSAGTFSNPVMSTANNMIEQAGNRAGDTYQNLSGLANQFDLANTKLRSNYQASSYDPSNISVGAVDPSRGGLGSSGSIQMDPFHMFQAQGPETWNGGIMQSYMSPYQQGVVDVQKQRANQDFANQQQYRDDAAIHAGAYGGSRQAVADSLAHRNLQDELANIQATGSQSAFNQAQTQFNADRASQQAAGQTNLGAAITQQQQSNAAQLAAAQSNQGARLSEFGTMYQGNLQAQMANQKAQLDAQNLAEQSRQFGANYGDQSARFADTQNMAGMESSSRTQLAALQQALQATGQQNTVGANYADLYRLGNQIQGQNLQQQQGVGAIQDQRRQAGLDLGYQDFVNQQNFPYQQANFMSGILHGVPTQVNQDQTQMTQYKPNTAAQIIGGIAGIGGSLAGAFGGG
jgi:hypothetical protein